MNIIYSAGDYKQPSGLFMNARLTKDCPADGLRTDLGVAVAGTSGKRTAPILFWRGVIAAVAWAAKRSPDVRADLAEILRNCESSET